GSGRGAPVSRVGTAAREQRGSRAVIEGMQSKLVEIENLMLAGVGVAAIAFVAGGWWRTKQMVPTLSAFILAGAVVWGSANVGWFRDQVGKETSLQAPVLILARAHGRL